MDPNQTPGGQPPVPGVVPEPVVGDTSGGGGFPPAEPTQGPVPPPPVVDTGVVTPSPTGTEAPGEGTDNTGGGGMPSSGGGMPPAGGMPGM